ncbi:MULTISPECIES: RraA family protein [unclassified Sphingomonas]|uniref:RraA family protein n=1 Tax=unclassified Sphingomonas TaxID=196159 RepID=UPI0006FABA59|nr:MULTISPECIES: dimethylmenaquinone methyltransferase [unclassified Sphingomonas]KQX25136.1 dimethylmenaquinone methyltransferase [Sphingomonas sp. Root1294]KQY66153.1 dimethylmenaquinone methyltransferase [Sphingomonas sp. Root50]KRB89681.1 dimethylmenaquinone methyltransferase [Sphingomonas sp. Root720]
MTQSILDRLGRLDACCISDAGDQIGLPPAVTGIGWRSVRGRIAGRVATVTLAAGTAPNGSHRHLCTSAIERAGAGDVIVIEQRTGIDAAGWGGILSNAAKVRGLAGVIVEGPARDIDEAAELGFPVYSRSATCRTARGRIFEIASGEPVTVGDTLVNEGDYVVADSSGVVFVPASRIEELLAAAEKIAAREAAMTSSVRAGEPVSEVMGARYETMLSEPEAAR